MYNDPTFDNLFTGHMVGVEYDFPTASQNLVITFTPPSPANPFYLSAMEGDFTTDPVTITSETGESEDITIGNAPAKVLTATMLNPDSTMGSLTWGDGQVYIGCETATASADTYNSYPVHVLAGSVHYGINSSGNARRNNTNYTLGGTPVAVISNAAGNDVLFITDTKIGRYNGSFSVVTTPSAEQAYYAAKFRAMPYSVGVLLDANGCPSVYNSVEKNTKQTFGYVPMGLFDFSNVDAFGITFGVEAYDKMTVFDGDCTTWWNAIDFDNGGSGRTLSTLAGMVYSHYGFIGSPTISASAVNDSLVWNTNPITSYAVTGRDILRWLAEAMGCNARMGRTGGLEFWTFATEPITTVATIYPDIIVGNTRVKGRASVPKMTETICYNVLGAGYQVGSSGSPYYVVANPFIDPSGDLTSLTNINGLVTGIPAYYPNTISVACGDPRWDAGDFVTVNTTDGTSPYAVPIMHESLSFNGITQAVLTATGKQVRDIPESMLNTDLSSMVDSNPSAVVNKIQAVGIDADWITSGSIDASVISVTNIDADNITSGTIDADVINVTNVTAEKVLVTDASNRTLFEADSSTRNVEIAGFDVDYSGITKTQGTTTTEISSLGYIDFTDTDPDQPSQTRIGSEGVRVEDSLLGEDTSVQAGIIYLTSSPDSATLMANNLMVSRGSNSTSQTSSSVSATDGTNETATTATGVTFSDGVATPTLRVLRRSLNSSGNTTVTLGNGVYLAIVTHQNNSSTSETGLYIIQCNNTSSVLTIAAASNQTLSVSGHTLTWTTTNTYRQLRLIYLS